jgi:hypothetical protein
MIKEGHELGGAMTRRRIKDISPVTSGGAAAKIIGDKVSGALFYA